jgi:hypothetical protein
MRRAASSWSARLALGILGLALLVAAAASADAAEKKRVGVPRFDGPQEGVVRKAVMQQLSSGGYDVVGAKELDGAAHGAGVELDSNDGFKAVAKELAISAFVTGEVGKKKAKLTVRNGADGAVSGEGAFGGANPAKVAGDIRGSFLRRLGSAVDRGRAPPGAKKPSAPAPVEAEAAAGDEEAAPASAGKPSSGGSTSASAKNDSSGDEKETKSGSSGSSSDAPAASDSGSADATVAKTASAPAEGATEPGPRALDLEAGIRGFTRSLHYNDLRTNLRKYDLNVGPAIGVHVLLYPAGFFTSGVATAFGAELTADYALAVGSDLPNNGGTFDTEIHDFYGGARARVFVGGHELSVFGGGGEHAFKFKSTGTLVRGLLNIPDTIYRYWRAGGDARLQVAPGFTLDVSGAFRGILNGGGDIKDHYFPGLGVAGIDAAAGIGYQVTPSVEVRVSVDLRRYFYAMHSIKSDLTNGYQVAGGAVDQYIGGMLGAAYVFGGVSPSATPEAAAEPEGPRKKRHKKKAGGTSDDEASGGDATSSGDAASKNGGAASKGGGAGTPAGGDTSDD